MKIFITVCIRPLSLRGTWRRPCAMCLNGPMSPCHCRCKSVVAASGFHARRGACGWGHGFSVVSNQMWVAHVDDVDYNVLERFASSALGFPGHVEASYR